MVYKTASFLPRHKFLFVRLKNSRIMPSQCPSARLPIRPFVITEEMSEEISLDHYRTGPKTSLEPHRRIMISLVQNQIW